MAEIKIDDLAGDVARVMKDALYVSVGFGVLAFQKLQTQRVELQKRLDTQKGSGRDQMAGFRSNIEQQVKAMESRLDAIEERIDAALDELQAKLPDQAGELLGQARDAVKQAREQVLEMVGREKKATEAA